MVIDEFGNCYLTESEAIETLYRNPSIDISTITMEDPTVYNESVEKTRINFGKIRYYVKPTVSIKEFDETNQNTWHMPGEFKSIDIVDYVVGQCSNNQEVTRALEELYVYQKLNKLDLLKYMLYLVSVARLHNVVIGVGRGSSVSSFVLYLLGVHKINPLEFNIPMTDFLKEKIKDEEYV